MAPEDGLTRLVALILLISPAVYALAVERGPVVLTDKARTLHADSLVIDGHNDMPWEVRKQGASDFDQMDISQAQPTLQTDIPRLKRGGVGAQFWSVWVPVETARRGEALATTLEQIDLVQEMIRRYPNDLSPALSVADIESSRAAGKIASLIGVEGGHCIEGSIPVLRRLYGLGARYMTLTHADTLDWADSATDEKRNGGLTAFGEEVVREMNRLGMMVDLSHVSKETMADAIRVSEAPVIFSHSSARAVAKHPRNVPDEILRMLPEGDGVVMINFFSNFTVPVAAETSAAKYALQRVLEAKYGLDDPRIDQDLRRWAVGRPSPRGTIHDILDHIDHVVEVAGIDHAGFGSDYDGVSVLPTQLDDVSSFPYLTQGMIDRGYSDAEIKKVLGGNLMRVFAAVEDVARKK